MSKESKSFDPVIIVSNSASPLVIVQALVGGKRVGHVEAAPMVGLMSLHVDDGYRRRGIATKLMKTYINHVKQFKLAKRIVFTFDESNAPAKALYVKLGFDITKNDEDSCVGDRVATMII